MLQLQTTGVVIDDSFFPVDQVEALRSYAIQQHEQGGLQAAREVKLGDALQAAKAVDHTARDDYVCWATQELRSQSQALDTACQALEALHADLRKVIALSNQPAELQLALYPQEEGGCQYVKHRDALPTDDPSSTERKVTAILYTSTDWRQQDGGMLRLWQPPGTHMDGSAEETDIEPLGGRLVLFLSGALDHAVQPSTAARVALTAWMT
eukprot:jgi/Astpho2/656/Aster-x0948